MLLRTILPFFFCMAIVTTVCCQQPSNDDAVKHVDAKTFQKLIKSPKIVLLDVRTPQEFAQGHLPGAQNLDFSGETFAAGIAAIEKTSICLVYCKSGRRSAMAAEQMREAGFSDITDLKGGITAWQDARLPIEKK